MAKRPFSKPVRAQEERNGPPSADQGLSTASGLEAAMLPGPSSFIPTPVFVACSTNVGEGPVKLSHVCNGIPGRVEEWHIPF